MMPETVTADDVIAAFSEMQKNRGHPVSQQHIRLFKSASWITEKINPAVIVSPYGDFRGVSLSKQGLTIKDVLQEVLQSNNSEIINLLSGPLDNNYPPIIVFRRSDGALQVNDGCRRLLTACRQKIQEINAFVGTIR
jgi:hypothetical protein